MDQVPIQGSQLLTEDEVKDASETFDFLDLNRDGVITVEEALTAIKIMNVNIGEEDLRGISLQMKNMGRTEMHKTTFFRLLCDLKTTIMKEDEVTESELEDAFSACARVHNTRLVIFLKDLESLLNTLGIDVSHDEQREMMEEADFDGAGWIDFQKFKLMMIETGIFPGRTFKK